MKGLVIFSPRTWINVPSRLASRGLTAAVASILAISLHGVAAADIPAPSLAPMGPGGFTISPSLQNVRLDAGAPSLTYDLQISNSTPLDQAFKLEPVDFGSLDETGGVAFLGRPDSDQEHRYGLASWMGLEANTVVVKAGSRAKVLVTIQNRSSLAPGGHYGAILATALSDPGRTKEPRVSLRQVLSSLILLTKTGGAEANLRLVSQAPSHSGWQLPTAAELRFQNDGNVHVVPRGITRLIDPSGRVVAQGAMNEGSAVILPQSYRRLTTDLMSIRGAWLPGRYRLVTDYRYDGTEQTKTLGTSVWYAGRLLTWAAIVLLALGLAGLIWLMIILRRREWTVRRVWPGSWRLRPRRGRGR